MNTSKRPAKKRPEQSGPKAVEEIQMDPEQLAELCDLARAGLVVEEALGISPASPSSNENPSAAEALTVLGDVYLELIESKRERIQAGDGDELLDALLHLAMSDRPMPYWFSVQVAQAIRRYTHLQAKTLDEAFKIKRRKINFPAARKRRQVGWKIYADICHLHKCGVPITQDLFTVVGRLHGVGRNVAAECDSREKKRLYGRRISTISGPSELPENLKPIYEEMTGKKIKSRV